MKSRLWGITCYFNPVANRGNLRYENYQRFRQISQKQGLPLCAIELLYDDENEGKGHLFAPQDGEKVIHVRVSRERGVLWQKERLLNIALEALPDECDMVCWIDADIIFSDNDWVAKTIWKLSVDGGDCSVIQPFSVVCMLPRDWQEDPLEMEETLAESPHRIRASGVFAEIYSKYLDAHPVEQKVVAPPSLTENFPVSAEFQPALDLLVPSIGGKTGLVWAARRELLNQLGGFYDCNAIGGGDCILYAAFNVIENLDTSAYSDAHAASIKSYLQRAHDVMHGVRVGCLDGLIMHMWHGKMKNRRYGVRNTILATHNFDPAKHLTLNKDNVWEWNETTPKELLDGMVKYFRRRRECN